jgi:transposase-like protein
MAQKKKKQTRQRYSDELKAAAVARAQQVGPAQAGRERGLETALVSMWARRAGVPVASFRGARISDEQLAAAGPPPSLASVSSNPEPRQVTMTPPPNGKQKRIIRPDSVKQAVVERAKVVGVSAAAKEIGVGSSIVSRWVEKAGVQVPSFRFTPGRGLRQVEVTPPSRGPLEQQIAKHMVSSTGTQLSRPEPSAIVPARKGRPPKSSRAEQLPLYQEPQRVQAVPMYDEAERAREQAQSDLKDELLRQALKEREAFKTVMEIMMREKNER